MTAREQQHAARFHKQLDVTRHFVGRALVRAVLAFESGTGECNGEFTCNAWDKPELPGCEWAFNISHSGSVVWAAFCQDAAVGIDCEQTIDIDVADIDSLASYLHPAERKAILALPAAETPAVLSRCWIRKEAIIKAIGEGLSRSLSSFRVQTDLRPTDWLAEIPDTLVKNWTVCDLPDIAGTQASVAAMAGDLPVTCHLLER